MQDTTIKQFEKTLSKKKFAYEQRIKNDQEEEEKQRLIKEQLRKDEEEKIKLEIMEYEK